MIAAQSLLFDIIVLFVTVVLSASDDERYRVVSVDFASLELLSDDIYFEILEPDELSYTYKIHPARNFGGQFNVSYSGIGLVVSEPYHGCSMPYNAFEIKNNIVLVQRGECSFLSKALQAEQIGANGILIADSNHFEDDDYIEMIADETKRHTSIPAAFLLGKTGRIIHHTLKSKNLGQALINIPVNLTNIPDYKRNHPPWLLW